MIFFSSSIKIIVVLDMVVHLLNVHFRIRPKSKLFKLSFESTK